MTTLDRIREYAKNNKMVFRDYRKDSFIKEDLMRPESLRYEEICGDGGVIESDDGEIGVTVASSDEE